MTGRPTLSYINLHLAEPKLSRVYTDGLRVTSVSSSTTLISTRDGTYLVSTGQGYAIHKLYGPRIPHFVLPRSEWSPVRDTVYLATDGQYVYQTMADHINDCVAVLRIELRTGIHTVIASIVKPIPKLRKSTHTTQGPIQVRVVIAHSSVWILHDRGSIVTTHEDGIRSIGLDISHYAYTTLIIHRDKIHMYADRPMYSEYTLAGELVRTVDFTTHVTCATHVVDGVYILGGIGTPTIVDYDTPTGDKKYAEYHTEIDAPMCAMTSVCLG